VNILIPISGRSDEGLVMPIFKRLQSQGHNAQISFLPKYCPPMLEVIDWDCVLITGDRIEQTRFALSCFLSHWPIAHLYAGIQNNLATFDDVNRHCITLWSDLQFCESKHAEDVVKWLCNAIGKPTHTYVTGITHLDDLEINPWFASKQTKFDLVLYNPPTLGNLEEELKELEKIILPHKKNVYMVYPNQDEGYARIIEWAKEHDIFIHEYTRPEFLGMLKTCRRFITNSSCEYYEAPYFLKPEQIIHVGERNKNRDKGPFATGASDKIVKILEDLYG
jgi:UDP-N-acetylglucosamine 2-epimerase